MDIQNAKNEIKNTIEVYLKKNMFNEYIIPINKQRPILLLGSAGIGKTAIIEQIGSELNLPVVSYNMTHHTRQSAIGLPYIEEKSYNGVAQKKSEYTMSEIVGSVYDMIESTGNKEGILFLDEVNCVSETLAPIMLQLLQNKEFGSHKIPTGYIIITAGNPPQYNKSAKTYDIATLDRLKVMEVTAQFATWKEYAIESGVHDSIVAFLTNSPEYLNSFKKEVDRNSFVTPRGWEDFSRLLHLYEEAEFKISKDLIIQYIQYPDIASKFYAFYKLYLMQKDKFNTELLLEGDSQELGKLRNNLKFEEKLIVSTMLSTTIRGSASVLMTEISINDRIKALVKTKNYPINISESIQLIEQETDTKIKSNNFKEKDRYEYNLFMSRYEEMVETVLLADSEENIDHDTAKKIVDYCNKKNREFKKQGNALLKKLENSFLTINEIDNSDNVINSIYITDLNSDNNFILFASQFKSEIFKENFRKILTLDKGQTITSRINDLRNN